MKEEQKNKIEKLKTFFESLPKKRIKNPSDTFAHIFRHDYKENFISDWLAYLLNPEKMGTEEPLLAFFKITKTDSCELKFLDLVIEREYDLEDCGRIDLYLESESIIMGIENKINSGFTSTNQLDKYYRKIKK